METKVEFIIEEEFVLSEYFEKMEIIYMKFGSMIIKVIK